MPLINGIKFACNSCIKGHRSSHCNHLERPLFEIRRKGRPVTQCAYCRDLRKTKQMHVKCMCSDRKGSDASPSSSSPGNAVAPAPASATVISNNKSFSPPQSEPLIQETRGSAPDCPTMDSFSWAWISPQPPTNNSNLGFVFQNERRTPRPGPALQQQQQQQQQQQHHQLPPAAVPVAAPPQSLETAVAPSTTVSQEHLRRQQQQLLPEQNNDQVVDLINSLLARPPPPPQSVCHGGCCTCPPQVQQGESVVITITPLPKQNDHQQHHDRTTATMTRVVTCYCGPSCICPDCLVHPGNNFLANMDPYADLVQTVQSSSSSCTSDDDGISI